MEPGTDLDQEIVFLALGKKAPEKTAGFVEMRSGPSANEVLHS